MPLPQLGSDHFVPLREVRDWFTAQSNLSYRHFGPIM